MSQEDLAGLFGGSAGSGSQDTSDDSPEWIDDGWLELPSLESNYDDNDRLNSRIRRNKFHPEFQSELDNGKGRDDLVEYVWKQFGEEYGVEEVTDLQVYLLDQMDENGEMLGKDVFEYVQEFEDADGVPEYLKDFDPA